MKKSAFFLLCLLGSLLSAVERPFIITVKTDNPGTSNSKQFTLPLAAGTTYDFSVDWGDGSSQIITTATSPTHTYATAGTYTIAITERPATGGFPRIYFNEGGDGRKLLTLAQWGDVDWADFTGAFAGCNNLVITATDQATARTGAVLSFFKAWASCSSLTSFPLIDTSAAISFYSTWYGCFSLTSFPLINTSAATSLDYTWSGCSGLTSFPLIDTSAATSLNRTWADCSSLASFPLINTANVGFLSGTWAGCSSLASFPLINTATATNISSAWFNCSSLTSFPHINTASVTNFSSAWYNCSSLTDFPLINTANGTAFTRTWRGCGSLTDFPLINTAAGTNFDFTWFDCSSLTSFPLINTAAGTSFWGAWSGCSSLGSFPALDFSRMTNGVACFTSVTLPTATYSTLLADLAARNTASGVIFDGGNSRFTTSGATARTTLTTAPRNWTITDGGPAVPIITSPTAASVQQGVSFTYTITASDNPTSFGASGVPSPLTHVNGVISGTAPASTGTYPITLSATNAQGTGNATLTVYVNAAGAPVITSAISASGQRGQAMPTYQITATNSPTAWAAVGLPPGLTCSSTGAITGMPTMVGTTRVSLRATNANGTGVATLTITVSNPGGTVGSTGSSGGGSAGGGCGAGALSALVLALFACLAFQRNVSTRDRRV